MSHEVFVNMETAKQLKQAGFDWEVRAHYCEKETSALLYDGYPSAKWNSELYDGCLSAPTQAVAHRWIREVKLVSISVIYKGFHVSNNTARFEWQVLFEKIIPEVIGFRDVTQLEAAIFPTYEAALEAGIQKCLSLING